MALGVIFFVIWVGIEIGGRKKKGVKPASLLEMLKFMARSRSKEQPQFRALLFALFCVSAFAIWESFLWLLFGRQEGSLQTLFTLTGLLLVAQILFERFRFYYWPEERQKIVFTPRRLALFFLGFVFILGSWVTALLLGPWLVYRYRQYSGKAGEIA